MAIGQLEHLTADVRDTTIGNTQRSRSCEGEIDHAATNVWSAIVYDDYYRLFIREVSYAYFRSKRQGAVSCGWQITIKR